MCTTPALSISFPMCLRASCASQNLMPVLTKTSQLCMAASLRIGCGHRTAITIGAKYVLNFVDDEIVWCCAEHIGHHAIKLHRHVLTEQAERDIRHLQIIQHGIYRHADTWVRPVIADPV